MIFPLKSRSLFPNKGDSGVLIFHDDQVGCINVIFQYVVLPKGTRLLLRKSLQA